jgi:2-polyprenyl-3-methyl-5-hydroxy-6-metoxy-1,4-benzoquinol methylase
MTIHTEKGVIVGNIEDKANPTNPVSAGLIRSFDETLICLLGRIGTGAIHEVGCGEGRLTRILCDLAPGRVRASDISESLIARNRNSGDLSGVDFVCKSIYDLTANADSADAVVCCEVLEHLDHPQRGLEALKDLSAEHYILSVPREPIWRLLNMSRGKYLSRFGNTPGHLNHWSSSGFVEFLKAAGFLPVAVRRPLPWTMVYGHFG